MRNLHDTIMRLRAVGSLGTSRAVTDDHRLKLLTDFGSNPGDLLARTYVPKTLRAGAPLVVVLHGCTQTAATYNHGAGWTEAAEQHGFALLFPEQKRTNNSNLCFNWFSPQDSRRGRGETLSIHQMVEAMHERHDTDRKRVFVSGLSAGGAMAAVMLATYPEDFASGAIIAGLPYGTAQSVPQAFDRMRGHGRLSPDALASNVRFASDHAGPWPTISVWHGTADSTVDPSNALAIVDQWRGIHGVPRAFARKDTVNGYPRAVWENADGREVIEEYTITGMGHGTPLSQAEGFGETPGPFMLEVGISSTRCILNFWGIDEVNLGEPITPRTSEELAVPQRPHRVPEPMAPNIHGRPAGVTETIEDALRAAGLMS